MDRVPMELARRHAAMLPGDRLDVTLPAMPRQRELDVAVGAGFGEVRVAQEQARSQTRIVAVRLRSLADTVGPGMRMLTCGLNPSLYAADAGVGYARPGNRFWPALLAAGLATVDRDPVALLVDHHVGMTDLVKRATVGAGEISRAEFVDGIARVERLCGWLRPQVLYLVGLQGWRAGVDRRAVPGLQPNELGSVPVYVAPSTSGANARTSVADHVAHLQRALAVTME
jgi:double-stranded uracil-DNA glycosylase